MDPALTYIATGGGDSAMDCIIDPAGAITHNVGGGCGLEDDGGKATEVGLVATLCDGGRYQRLVLGIKIRHIQPVKWCTFPV